MEIPAKVVVGESLEAVGRTGLRIEQVLHTQVPYCQSQLLFAQTKEDPAERHLKCPVGAQHPSRAEMRAGSAHGIISSGSSYAGIVVRAAMWN